MGGTGGVSCAITGTAFATAIAAVLAVSDGFS
jgi:hypothetical protein